MEPQDAQQVPRVVAHLLSVSGNKIAALFVLRFCENKKSRVFGESRAASSKRGATTENMPRYHGTTVHVQYNSSGSQDHILKLALW